MIEQPTPAQIVAARKSAGHTQPIAAATVFATADGWKKWESGARPRSADTWGRYCLMTGEHPDFGVVPREAGAEA